METAEEAMTEPCAWCGGKAYGAVAYTDGGSCFLCETCRAALERLISVDLSAFVTALRDRDKKLAGPEGGPSL